MTKIKIDRSYKENGDLPLYCKYPQQCDAQPAYLYITEIGEISIEVDGDIGGGCSADVWHRRTLRYPVNCLLTQSDIDTLLDSKEFVELAERIIAGHEVGWDRSGGNIVGTLSEDAAEASEDLERYLEMYQPSWDEVERIEIEREEREQTELGE